ncbi:MAG: helix-turn-helix transcriptional regulator [Bacilli bacterium]
MNTLLKIKNLRIEHNYTQKYVAEKLNISPANYCRYESGEWNFTIQHIKQIADFYKVSLSYLLDDKITDILITKEQYDKLLIARDTINEIERGQKK